MQIPNATQLNTQGITGKTPKNGRADLNSKYFTVLP